MKRYYIIEIDTTDTREHAALRLGLEIARMAHLVFARSRIWAAGSDERKRASVYALERSVVEVVHGSEYIPYDGLRTPDQNLATLLAKADREAAVMQANRESAVVVETPFGPRRVGPGWPGFDNLEDFRMPGVEGRSDA